MAAYSEATLADRVFCIHKQHELTHASSEQDQVSGSAGSSSAVCLLCERYKPDMSHTAGSSDRSGLLVCLMGITVCLAVFGREVLHGT